MNLRVYIFCMLINNNMAAVWTSVLMFDRINELQDLIRPNLRYPTVTPTNLEALPVSELNTDALI